MPIYWVKIEAALAFVPQFLHHGQRPLSFAERLTTASVSSKPPPPGSSGSSSFVRRAGWSQSRLNCVRAPEWRLCAQCPQALHAFQETAHGLIIKRALLGRKMDISLHLVFVRQVKLNRRILFLRRSMKGLISFCRSAVRLLVLSFRWPG